MFKVAKFTAGTSEPPPLPPTTVVADFKRRRKETEAERFVTLNYCIMLHNFNFMLLSGIYSTYLASRLAKKASKSHKRNISEFNDLMEKLPVHNEQRKINWYKF